MTARTHLPTTATVIDGLLTLANAVPDLGMIIDCADCGEEKFAKIGLQHDLMSSLTDYSSGHRVRFSDLRAHDMVFGTESKVAEAVRALVRQRHSKLVLLVPSSVALLLASDLPAIAADLEEELGVPVAAVSARPLSGDYLEGFEVGLEALANKVVLEAPADGGVEVGLVGYVFERFEEDQRANVRELRRLLRGLDREVSAVWLDGARAQELGSIGRAGTLLSMPGGRRAAEVIARRGGARVVECGLPIGLDGTARWLTGVGEALGCADLAARFIEQELGLIVPRIERAVRRDLLGRSVVVAGGPHYVAELAEFLAELGLVVRLVLVQSRSEADGEQIGERLRRCGQEPEILVDPTVPLVEDALTELAKAAPVDVIVGSGSARDAAKPLRIPYVEISYPCYVRHALFDAPWLGFRGALWLTDAIAGRLSEASYIRY
jgi:nitrogenase molybdenum-iron protein alpha/beta subunit